MNYKKTFETLIYCQILLFIIFLLAIFFPTENAETFNDFIWEKLNASLTTIVIGLGLGSLFLTFISWYLLLKFKKVGRDIYLIAILLDLIGQLVSAPYAADTLLIFAVSVNYIIAGATLMLAYHSSLSSDFN